jgi:hypothetical protein
MSFAHHTVLRILALGALCALLSGCPRAERHIPANVNASDYRRSMVQWHQQHDRQPVAPASGQ